MLFHILLFDAVSRLTRQNHKFAYHILPAQVDARIRLRISLIPRLADCFAQRHIGTESVKYVIQRAAHHGLDLQDFVAAVYQIVDCIDHRQSGSHIGFKQELHTALARYFFQFGIIVIRR